MGQVSSRFGRRSRSDPAKAKRKKGRKEEQAKPRDEANKQDRHLEQCSEFVSLHTVLDAEMNQSKIQKDLLPELEMLTSICDLQNEMETEIEELKNLQLLDAELELTEMDQGEQTEFPTTSKDDKEPTDLELSSVELELAEMDQGELTEFPTTSKDDEEPTDLELSSVELELAEMDQRELTEFPTASKDNEEPTDLELSSLEQELAVMDQQELTKFPTTSKDDEEPTDLQLSSVELELAEMDQAAPKAIFEPPAEDLAKSSKRQSFNRYLQASPSIEGDNTNDQEPRNENKLERLHQRWKKHCMETRIKHKEEVMRKYQKNWETFEQRLDAMNAEADRNMEMFQIRRNTLLKYQCQPSETPASTQRPNVLTRLHQRWKTHCEERRVKHKEKIKRKYQKNWKTFEKRLNAMNAEADKVLAQGTSHSVGSVLHQPV